LAILDCSDPGVEFISKKKEKEKEKEKQQNLPI
jgi:hypothetical protein